MVEEKLIDTPHKSPEALIVDDDEHVCQFIKAYVDSLDFVSTTLSRPESFTDVYRVETDLIILDLNMPQVDGIELIRFLGDNKSNAHIILMSAAEKDILLAAQELATSHNLSVLGVLDKPIDVEKLNSLLEKCLARTQMTPAFNPAIDSLTLDGTNELPSIEELHKAIAANQIDVHFQPKIRLSDNTFAGVEALARWNHPEKGLIPPAFFIPFAEEFEMIGPLTKHIMAKTCAHASSWGGMSVGHQISVNISEISLGDLRFPDLISNVVNQNGMRPSQIVLEITESTLSINPKAALDVLTRLRLRGFSLSIDDFGTGHSSLSRLRQIPFSELKIDKSFIDEVDTNKECQIIVKNTINLADSLGLIVVAEGAETQSHIDTLSGFGCDVVQGYFYSKPLPNDQFLDWLKKWNESHDTSHVDVIDARSNSDS